MVFLYTHPLTNDLQQSLSTEQNRSSSPTSSSRKASPLSRILRIFSPLTTRNNTNPLISISPKNYQSQIVEKLKPDEYKHVAEYIKEVSLSNNRIFGQSGYSGLDVNNPDDVRAVDKDSLGKLLVKSIQDMHNAQTNEDTDKQKGIAEKIIQLRPNLDISYNIGDPYDEYSAISRSAVQLAAEYGEKDLVLTLLEAGAKPAGEKGRSSLCMLNTRENSDSNTGQIIYSLLSSGVNPNTPDKSVSSDYDRTFHQDQHDRWCGLLFSCHQRSLYAFDQIFR